VIFEYNSSQQGSVGKKTKIKCRKNKLGGLIELDKTYRHDVLEKNCC
jgi:hypothetical protein